MREKLMAYRKRVRRSVRRGTRRITRRRRAGGNAMARRMRRGTPGKVGYRL